MVGRPPQRDEVWLESLDPTKGVEIQKTRIQKTRPCLVVSPDEMNQHLRTVIIAPMTTVVRPYPTRVLTRFQGKPGQVVLDQLRAVAGNAYYASWAASLRPLPRRSRPHSAKCSTAFDLAVPSINEC